MKDVLAKSQEVLASLTAKEAAATARLAAVERRELDVQQRESRASEYENAEAVLAAVEERRKATNTALAQLDEERAKFENWAREERQALKNEEGRLASLQDREKQLAADRAALYAREQAFEKEKVEIEAVITKRVKDHFRNTSGG
jgi:chromosome segregation ATPase